MSHLLQVRPTAVVPEGGPLHRVRTGWGAAAEDTALLLDEDIRW